jgi:hypothetical protein
MTLAALKTKLSTLTGTDIGEVIFDWNDYLNDSRTKVYPVVYWMMDGMEFTKDIRTSTIQKQKPLTLTVYIIASFDKNTQDKITVWDVIEPYLDAYLNKVNEMTGLTIENIDELKGVYYGLEPLSPDQEIGMAYKDIILKMWC